MGARMLAGAPKASYRRLLSDGSFFRFFTSQVLSSLGDWIALVAILALVRRITEDEFAVAAMLLARLAPALLFGPVAGVLSDRWNRKRVMVACDLGRGALIATLPFIETVSRTVPVLNAVVLLLIVSALLEMLTLLWLSAKDAAVPEMVQEHQLTHANSLLLLAAYLTFPLSGAAFGALAAVAKWLGATFELFREFQLNQEGLAFLVDAVTFGVSALLVATLRIPPRTRKIRKMELARVWEELTEGIRFTLSHPRIRPWVIGIGMIFLGVGAFFAIAVFYVTDVLGAGSAGFGLMVGVVGAGLAVGFAIAGAVSRLIARDVFFSLSVFALGILMISFASVSTLTTGLFVGAALGVFAGFAYPSGLTLVQENADEEVRGRTIAAMHSMVRLALVASLAAAPALSKLVDTVLGRPFIILGQQVDLQGIRVTMWIGGVSIIVAGIITTRAVSARWRGVRMPYPGIFLVFEGGEGTGKSTQVRRLTEYLRSEGMEVEVTREPGGTEIGRRIRDILLDPRSEEMSPKTEALLYAADRAQHVREVIAPALKQGKIVISDRYLDSSLAYQGIARSLGVEKVLDISAWASDDLLPDLVFLLDMEAGRGLRRSLSEDRIEGEGVGFHELVRRAYRMLAERFPDRFVVLDATRSAEEVAADVRRRVLPLLEGARGRVRSRAR